MFNIFTTFVNLWTFITASHKLYTFDLFWKKNYFLLITICTTRQSDLLHLDRYQSNFASSLPLYSLPIVWNIWVFVVSNNMHRIQFKTKIKLACINKCLSHVKCNDVVRIVILQLLTNSWQRPLLLSLNSLNLEKTCLYVINLMPLQLQTCAIQT